jgi:hypothetical protein
MSTSVEDTVRLDLGGALGANPAGVAAVAVAIVLLVRRPAHLRVSPLIFYSTLAAMWLFELHRFGFL